ncbi:hypothetical protein JHK85_033394 [Glycine max]|nr:hypothetical protein JHK85_033394 [Glycine max]
MTVEKRIVLVGIRIDGYSRQLLNWALAKVAEPGDCVIAVHVVKSSDYVSKNKTLIDGYLEVYEGLCGVKKVGLTGQIFTGSSIKNILVREAKKHAALALVVGYVELTKTDFNCRGRAATAKYCAKRLQPTTNVLAIQDSRIVFRSCTNKQLPGGLILDPRPSLTIIKENLRDRAIHSSICDSIVEIEESTRKNSLESKEEAFNGSEKSKSRSISMFAGDSAEQKLGWPLLRRANSGMSQTLHARDMSVVQWVMTLPDRSPNKGSSSSSTEENPFERSISDVEYESSSNSSPSSVDIPNGLEEMLNLNSLNCKRFSLEVLKSCTSQFSSEKLVGKGGSNRVYKGVLTDGKSIAVKVMQSSKEAWKDFALEVEIISSLEHKSIAPLLGICIENNTLISVYDYFPNGSLEENLHGKVSVDFCFHFSTIISILMGMNNDANMNLKMDIGKNKDESILSWEVRFNVAIRIAEALDYLHREALKPVIHKDVKSSNILLSQGFEPQAKPIIESGNVKGLLDPNLEGKFDEAQLQRMVLAASLCITRAARLRPKLSQILKILKGEEKVEYFLNSQGDNDQEDSENQENIDDEVYPNSSAELHLSLALLGVDDDSTSHSSTDHSYSEDLKEQWSRVWTQNKEKR